MDDEFCGCGGRNGKHAFACVTDRYASPTTATKCALCSVVLYTGAVDDGEAMLLEQEHRKVCDKRPVEAGDWVRWEHPDAPTNPTWIEGELLDKPDPPVQKPGYWHAKIRVHAGPGWTVGSHPVVGVGLASVREDGSPVRPATIRRVPRPGQETVIRTPVGDITMRPDPTLKPGEFRLEKPAPQLVESLDASQLWRRWGANRAALDSGNALIYEMTPEQIAVAKDYDARWAAHRSAQLSAKVAASKERERNLVSYCEVDDAE